VAIEVVLLDIDGTLLDTTEFIHGAFEHTARTFGLTLPPREVLRQQVGRPLGEIYAEHAIDQAVAELVETHRTFQVRNLHLAAPFPGAGEALAALRASGYRLAAITSRSGRTSVLTLELAGLAPHFATVISAEDTEHLKPHPAPLELGLERLGASASYAVMVGDTAADVLAGQALGMPTIAALYGFQGEAVRSARPTVTITNIGELPAALAGLTP
jgi:HAD superfamily hydrolase (TIGR01509 family)